MSPRLRSLLVLLIGLLLGATLSWMWWSRSASAPADTVPIDRPPAQSPGSARSLAPSVESRLAEIFDKVQADYVDEVPADRLVDAALRAMVGTLDSYSAYLDRREYEDLRRAAAGNYPGIGIEVIAEGETIKVLRTLADSPALRAGIRKDDVILRIDEEPVGRDVMAAIEQMRGPPGSLVRLTLRRADTEEVVNVALERARVAVQSVSSRVLAPAVAYVRIASFSETTAQEFERQLVTLQQPGPLRLVVLDLRNNPGGVFEAAVAIADTLLESGVIVSGVGRSQSAQFRLTATPGEMLAGVPLAVLVDRGSASAAEILAGALKDQRRARIFGQRTYGKGSVQTVVPLADGHALKLTTSRYATPSGTLINERGIEPDVMLPASPPREEAPESDPQVIAAWRNMLRASSNPAPRT
ncbi:MAG: S41 family peptidase [Steroidobacteraceae bacterium]